MNKLDIINFFKNKNTKGNLIELKFLKKYIHKKSNIYIDKKTGFIRSELKHDSKTILDIWSNEIFNKDQESYSGKYPYAKARLFYVLLESMKYFNEKKINYKNKVICDFASGEGIFIDNINDFFKTKIKTISVEAGSLNCKNMKKKGYNVIQSPLGFGNLERLNLKKKPDIGYLNWTLCNTIDPISVLNEVHTFLNKNSYLIISEGSRILVPFKKKLKYLFNKKYTADIHPWFFSKNSITSLAMVCGFRPVYENRYYDSDVMMIIFKKVSKNYFSNFLIDRKKDILSFFKNWEKQSQKKYFGK